MSKSKAGTKSRAAVSVEPIRAYVKYRPLYYIAAFLIPALLGLIAYAFFRVYPFGTRSVLTLDLNGQYVYYFENIRRCFWEGKTALYSWARNLSGGFQGVIGYYLASPFTFIVILLPRSFILESLMIMQLCKLGAAGTAFCVYAQKSKNVPPLQSVIFSTMYALMAYSVIQLIDPMWVDGPVFLPLIILGVEYLVDDGRKINYIIPLSIMFIANFYIGFMVAIFVALYFVYYLFAGTSRKFRNVSEYASTIGTMIIATITVLLCSYIMIVPVYNALALGKFNFSKPDYSFKTMFNPIELVPCLLPDQYYSVNVDTGTKMYGRPEIYCGVLSACLAPLYFINREIKLRKKIGYGALLLVMFISMYIKPVNMMWHGGQDPNWLPYRYSFLVSFILVAMAADIFSKLGSYKASSKSLGGIFAVLAILVFLFEAKMPSFEYNETKYQYVAKFPYTTDETYNGEAWKRLWLGTLAFGLVLAAIYLIIVYLYSNAKKAKTRNVISIVLAAVVFFEAGYNTYDTFWKIHKEVYYSERSTYDVVKYAPNVTKELEEYDDSLYRTEKTFFRNVNDNQAWGLRGLSHSSSVMNTRILRFIETLGYSTKSYETRYDGNTPLADSLLGIKYVLDDPDKKIANNKTLLSPYYNKVFSTKYIDKDGKESDVDVYENPDALPIAFMADDDILKLSFLGNDNPFNSMNNFMSSMTGSTPDYSGELNPKSYFVRLPDPEVEMRECWESDYNGQHCYNANAQAADPTVNLHLTAQNDQCIYMFLKTDNPKGANLWISTEKDEEGNFINHKGYGGYFDGYEYSIINIGSYEPGTDIEIRLTIRQIDKTGNNEYIMIKDFQFYQFDYDAFHEDIQKLKASPMNINMDKFRENHIEGTVTAQEGQILYTSIPYETGWTIKVDGKTVNNLFEDTVKDDGSKLAKNNIAGDTGVVVILNAMIGLKLTPGEHTISMTYSPPGFHMGIITLIIGIAILVLFYFYDKKNNKVWEAERKMRDRMKQGLPPTDEPADKNKKVQILKSHSPKAEKDSAPAENNDEDEEKSEIEDSDSTEDNSEQENDSNNSKKKKKKK